MKGAKWRRASVGRLLASGLLNRSQQAQTPLHVESHIQYSAALKEFKPVFQTTRADEDAGSHESMSLERSHASIY